MTAKTDTIKERFEGLTWHDATLLWIELDRRDPGNRDEIALIIEWPDGRRNCVVFTDCYLLDAQMHFGIIAPESILSATCSTDAAEIDRVRETCRRYGGEFTDLHRFKVETNSTGSTICIVARGFEIREPPADLESWFSPREIGPCARKNG